MANPEIDRSHLYYLGRIREIKKHAEDCGYLAKALAALDAMCGPELRVVSANPVVAHWHGGVCLYVDRLSLKGHPYFVVYDDASIVYRTKPVLKIRADKRGAPVKVAECVISLAREAERKRAADKAREDGCNGV